MSSIYTLEPPTRGKVTIVTTLGDIDIELWSKECPLACRNFVQLCVDGAYDDTPFTRIVKDFMVQGGDVSAKGKDDGTGGASAFGKPFRDEIHSRLQFRRRALVACANESGKPNSNGSQFFITMVRLRVRDARMLFRLLV